MKVIKDNSKKNLRPEWPKRCSCSKCKSILEVDEEDVNTRIHALNKRLIRTIVCPICNYMGDFNELIQRGS